MDVGSEVFLFRVVSKASAGYGCATITSVNEMPAAGTVKACTMTTVTTTFTNSETCTALKDSAACKPMAAMPTMTNTCAC